MREIEKAWIKHKQMNPDLVLPCPFCGEKPSLISHGNGWAMVACENQDCPVKPSLGASREDGRENEEEMVILFWNRRF